MTSQFYDTGLEAILDAYFNRETPAADLAVYVVPVNGDYVFDSSHATTEDLGVTVLATELPLANITLANGVFDADDLVPGFPEMPVGETISALVIFAGWTGGSQLIAYIDSAIETPLPLTILMPKVNIRWNAQGIFRI